MISLSLFIIYLSSITVINMIAFVLTCMAINAICIFCCCKSAGKSERYMEQINSRKGDNDDNTLQ